MQSLTGSAAGAEGLSIHYTVQLSRPLDKSLQAQALSTRSSIFLMLSRIIGTCSKGACQAKRGVCRFYSRTLPNLSLTGSEKAQDAASTASLCWSRPIRDDGECGELHVAWSRHIPDLSSPSGPSLGRHGRLERPVLRVWGSGKQDKRDEAPR